MVKLKDINYKYYAPVIQAAQEGANVAQLEKMIMAMGNNLQFDILKEELNQLYREEKFKVPKDSKIFNRLHTVIEHGSTFAGHAPLDELLAMAAGRGVFEGMSASQVSEMMKKDDGKVTIDHGKGDELYIAQIKQFSEIFKNYYSNSSEMNFSDYLVKEEPKPNDFSISYRDFREAYANGVIASEKVRMEHGHSILEMNYNGIGNIKGTIIFPTPEEQKLSAAIADMNISESKDFENKTPFTSIQIEKMAKKVYRAQDRLEIAMGQAEFQRLGF